MRKVDNNLDKYQAEGVDMATDECQTTDAAEGRADEPTAASAATADEASVEAAADATETDGGACPHCHGIHDHKDRSDECKKKLLNRLKRAEGQIRGIEKMVENDAYCPDILIQVQAVTSALNSFNRELLANHIRGCVADDIREGNDATIDELVAVTQKLMK